MGAESSPPTFTDATGCTWRLVLTPALVATVKAAYGIDLARMVQSERGVKTEFGRGASMLRNCAAVIFTICEQQAAAERISPEAFARLLLPPTFDNAQAALLDAIAQFYPSSPHGRARLGTKKEA
jgi:hypothetical protein